MAKKKDKPQVINNIKELNLEIDYDKLAYAIVKAQKNADTVAQPDDKLNFWKAVWLIIRNKESKSGKRYATVLAEVMAVIFNLIALCSVVGALVVGGITIYMSNWNVSFQQVIWQIVESVDSVMIILGLFAFALICRGIANEIQAEKDRNYIISVFSGIVSFAALIVALVALFKGVG